MGDSTEGLVKVHIDLPHHWAIGGESLWAEELGGEKYRLCNVPFHAYGLNYKDVVVARPLNDEQIPEILSVFERSGNETLRLYFDEKITSERQVEYLDVICNIGASYERADKYFVAIDIDHHGKYGEVYDHLQTLEESKILSFETCEMRVEGSFDDVPPEE